MIKRSLYKKLVRHFESTINNYQNVNAKFDFNKFEKIISNQNKDNRYYRDIQQFLVYLGEYKDKNALIFIFPESRKKYQRLLEKVKTLLTARPLEVSRQIRSTNNCVIEDPHCSQYNDNFELTKYLDDLQKSPGFSAILNRNQLIEFWFKDTIFLLRKNCISRVNLARNPQRLCQSDYGWFIQSMAIPRIKNIVREEAHRQGLNLKEVDVAQITRDICGIDPTQQNARQLMGIYSKGAILEINESKLQNFIFNSEYLSDTLKSTFSGGNSSNLLPRIIEVVRLKLKNLEPVESLEPEESNAFTLSYRDHNPRSLPESQSMATSGLQQTNITSMRPNDYRSADGFNWMIIAVAGGIGIVFIIAIIIWYSKKNRSENSGLATEGIPLLKSISDNLHVLQIAGRLTKRLESLKHLERYDSEIGSHYISFCNADNNEKAIEDLKAIKGALTKFLEPKRSSNKDKILSNKLESALLIVDSLMQRYRLLSLPNTNQSKNNYITEQHKSGLEGASNLLLDKIEIIRINFEGTFFSKYNIKETSKLIFFALLLNLEKASYDTSLSAHIEGYFEKYERNEVINCLNLKFSNTNPVINNEIHWKNLQNLQEDLGSAINVILNPSKALSEELLKLKDVELFNAIKLCINKFECMKSQLGNYSGYCKGLWEEASKLQKQTQASIASVNSTFFGQPPSPEISQATSEYTMHR